MARPSKLTPELQLKICNALRAGNFVEPTCRAYGLDPSQFYRWMDRGVDRRDDATGRITQRAEKKYREFRKAVEEAQAQPEILLVSKTYQQAMGTAVVCKAVRVCPTCGTESECGATLQNASDGDARSREFLLSRKHAERWAGRDRLEHSGPGGGPIQTTTRVLRFGGRYRKDGQLVHADVPSTPADGGQQGSTDPTSNEPA